MQIFDVSARAMAALDVTTFAGFCTSGGQENEDHCGILLLEIPSKESCQCKAGLGGEQYLGF
jgi:hypothetical protein